MKKNLSVYAIAYLVLLLIACGLLAAYPKLELHLLLNSCHTSIQDTFFRHYSVLAEWPLYILALLPILWKQPRLTLFYALCELSAGAFLQILKHMFSSERPMRVFENMTDVALPLVQGVSLHHGNSFPSGHASTFFVFFTCCALLLAYRHQQESSHTALGNVLFHLSLLALLALAALGAYSRVYLSQHFLADVFVGSIIGFTTPLLFYHFGRKKILKLDD